MDQLADTAISAQDLAKHFRTQAGTLDLFKGINLEIRRGESVAIIGPSGTGKSTLLSLLAGLDQPSSGRILLNNTDLTELNDQQRAAFRNRHISFVFQAFHLLPDLTALQNVMLPLQIRNHKQAESEARGWLEKIGLGDRLQHKPAELSGGEQQRVAIARSFATEPSLLFADEPTGNLDEQTGEQIIRQLFGLNQEQGTTLILITHDPSLAKRCQRSLRLHNGVLTEIEL
ncbi:ABC transporter ATP-binding protein [Neptuniibacter halophilus]|uniref:ABC transporter ATP-binding protein n=1 Tax=Neptuniibacter halophilus TaxID=651666 RepID=UPI002573125D|nr:ABC transporter ATP-binding protein [Neptuniibacter halophilus]